MSFILDALRKSEQERRQIDVPVPNQPLAPSIELPQRGLTLWIAAALFGVVLVAVGVFWIWQSRPAAIAAIPVVPSAVTTTESTAAPRAVSANTSIISDVADDGNNRPAPELNAHPLVRAENTPSVRDLAEEARTAPVVFPSIDRPAPAAATASRNSVAESSPARAPEDAVKFLRVMPVDFQRALPELVVNIHIYAPRDSDRILYINNRQYHAGDEVRDGVFVEEIVEDGAVLNYRGQRFKLPRPS